MTLFVFDRSEEEPVCTCPNPFYGFCPACVADRLTHLNVFGKDVLVGLNQLRQAFAFVYAKATPRIELFWQEDRPIPSNRSGGLGGKKRGCTPGQSRVDSPGTPISTGQKSWHKHMIKTPARGP